MNESHPEEVASVETTTAPQDMQSRATLGEVVVSADAKWWGYEVHLNQDAVDLLDKILTVLDEALKKCFKNPELRRAVSICIQVKQIRLKNVTNRTGNIGCRLVSPWICPFALTVVRERAKEDLSLYNAVWDSTTRQWGDESAFTDIESASGPALAQHGDRLFCAYRGPGSDEKLYWIEYTPQSGWSDDTPHEFPYHWTSLGPTLVEFKGKLFCFHKGRNDDKSLYSCTFNDELNNWDGDQQIPNVLSNTGSAAAVLNDILHVVFAAPSGGALMHIQSIDGRTWTDPVPLPGHQTYDTPALAAYQGKLHLLHKGTNSTTLWHAIFENGSWGPDVLLPNHSSLDGPALAVHDGLLCMVHRSSGSASEVWYATYNGTAWATDAGLPNHHTGDNPAVVSYMDPASTSENYEEPTYAGARLITVYRGQ
jgi:hypothetical protein